MDSIDIITEASQSSKIAGTLTFIISGFFVTFNFYEPGHIPESFLSGMHFILLTSTIGTGWLTIKYRNYLHVTNQTCPKCKSRMIASELKCLDEYKKECNYTVKT
ncbi:MAG: hypothetical protein PWQ50_1461 [Methanolobus sp.]|jgi:hypothetical protein|nr:hypothetical protein [Methanolobus sp.]